jgi:SpoVK/Ycf46/Vps4 family AAA+-type ATPase
MLLADERHLQRDALLVELAGAHSISFLAGNTAWEPIDAPARLQFVRVEFSRPSARERGQFWARALRGEGPTANTRETIPAAPDARLEDSITATSLAELAGTFRLSAGQIRDAAATARGMARWRDPDGGRVTLADLNAACRLQSNPKLATLAKKIEPHYAWADIVLPTDRLAQLREICDQVRFRARVHEDWGFGRKLALGKGLAVLFAGPSGTGKTMAAEIIAGELGLDLYKIDLALVVSKYIGETEKNLGRIFAEAEASNAILFFDEADALFGKRGEVGDAHDRYANLEVAYLLQRIEEYEGITILATNLRKNMDDAFVRRMQFIVEFPFPSERDRMRIWEQVWPASLPRDPALDLAFMARRCEIAGGNIRNIALAAAFLAAADGEVVTNQHLARATRREYQKMGKVIGEGEFGE